MLWSLVVSFVYYGIKDLYMYIFMMNRKKNIDDEQHIIIALRETIIITKQLKIIKTIINYIK